MLQVKQELLAALSQALDGLLPGSGDKAAFESPKVAAHGDFAITAAMQLAIAGSPIWSPGRGGGEGGCVKLYRPSLSFAFLTSGWMELFITGEYKGRAETKSDSGNNSNCLSHAVYGGPPYPPK